MAKPNCYKCKHRRNLPYDHHSRCAHPLAERRHHKAAIELNIEGNAHGIKNGWFMWPYNFDPLWLEQCNGFESKDAVSDSVSRATSADSTPQ